MSELPFFLSYCSVFLVFVPAFFVLCSLAVLWRLPVDAGGTTDEGDHSVLSEIPTCFDPLEVRTFVLSHPGELCTNQEVDMSTLSTDRKPLVDYGVQIRFIKDLHDTGGASPDKSRGISNHTPTSHPGSKYGVAVRVQGISGQPYVVLNDGAKGDSYGVQLNTPGASPVPQSPYKSAPKGNEAAEGVNTTHSSVSPTEDEEIYRSPLRRPPGDGQAGGQGEEEGRTVREGRSKAEPQVKVAAPEVQTQQECTSQEEYNEAGLKPVKVNGAGPRGFKQNAFTSSKKDPDSPAEFLPKPLVSTDEKPIDTNSLAPINKLISKFNSKMPGGGPQARGRTGARQQLRFDERKRSKSLDARKESPLPSPPSPTFNPYASTSSSLSSRAGLERDAAPVVNKVTARESPKKSFKSSGKSGVKEAAPVVAKKPEIPPRSLSQKATSGEEAQVKQAIYSILKEGTSESESSLKRKTNLVYETTSNLKKGGSDGNQIKLTLAELEEQLGQCKKQLQRAHEELAEERIAREMSESRMRLQEDQLAELQEELRRVSETVPPSDSLTTDMMTLQAELAEAAMLRHRQDETLRQRERELTALKGALKEEVECHDREMETLREQYSQDMHNLRMTMEQVTQSQEQIEEERERVNASLLSLEEELDSCRDQGEQWKSQLDATTQELHLTKDKLLQCHLEKEEFESKLKEVQDSLLGVHKRQMSSSSAEELQRCHDDLHRARLDADKHKGALDKKSEALDALRKASGEREAELLSEIGRMEEQKADLEKALEKAKEASSAGRTVVDHITNTELQETNTRLRERLARMRIHSSTSRSPEAEEAMEALEDENRSLKSQLEEAKRGASRLSKEKDELSRRLEERDLEREVLRRGKSELEEQKRLLDRALEKLNKEMEMMMGDSRQSVVALQTQLDEYRERSRKDLLEAQRTNKDRLAELQRAQSNLKTQQEEVSRLKKELLTCSEERDSAQLERDLLNNRLKHLESELESEKGSQTDRTREVRGLEDKIKTLEIELDEERSSVELLNDRITRSRDQVDQLRSELMQERSARHDLEMDKSAIDRQVKELRSRVADMEGQTRPSAGIALLESKIQELEERLRSEEREKSSIQASHRRTERKLKEVNATLDQERTQHVEQKDQLTLRVKALKRQVDESEGEVERLEGVRRKVLRELEEQQELQEALQAKVTALESELKRKAQQSHRSTLATLSSEDEDAFSILSDGHHQGSNC
ncbi:cingulin isoform X2 [Dunckerocampus dactyliophorus]|uniref:cingulin isoform X2 n=1 Tax=Dunckerocampus dactyliophorus TaxID=161453 RepID=UPI002406EB8D|nr:cingulin isoform X2 [Dunckerocampus dactyliophorus]